MNWEVGDDEWLAQPNAARGTAPVDDLDDRVIRSLGTAPAPESGRSARASSEPLAAPTEPPVEAYALSSDDLPPPPYSAAFDTDHETPSYESGSFVSEPDPAPTESASEPELDFHIPTLSMGAIASPESSVDAGLQPTATNPVEAVSGEFVIPTLSAAPVAAQAVSESGEGVEEVPVEELEEVVELVDEQPVRTGDTVITRAPGPDSTSATITASVYDDDDEEDSGLVIPELVERVDSSELEVLLEDPEFERASDEPEPVVDPDEASGEFVIPNLARSETADPDARDELVIPSLVVASAAGADAPVEALEVELESADVDRTAVSEELHAEELHEVDAEAIESLDSADIEEVEQPVPVTPAIEPSEPKPPTPPEVKPQAKRRKAWYDDVFAEHFLFLYPLTWEHTCERDAQFIFTLIGGQDGASVLDVGCGDGRHAVELAKLGARVTGLDNSLALLLAAAQTKESAGIEDGRVEFIHGDMRRLPRDRDFDAVICVGTSLGYFEEEQNWLCLQEMHDRLRPGGRLLIHVFNRDFVAPHLPSRSWWQGKRCMVIDEAEMNFFANRLRVHRTIIFDDGRQYEHYMFMRAYTVQDLGKAISQLGMRVLEVAGSRDTRGRFYGSASPDIWIVAEKK